MENTKLYLLPPLNEGVKVTFTMETFNYEYGSELDDYGDREVVDVSREFSIQAVVPKISFLDWIETLCSLRNNQVTTTHLYTKQIIPYTPDDSAVWAYFNQVKGNLLTNGYRYDNQYKVRIYMYFIEEFNYFVLLRLLTHHDKVTLRS
ncbi:hypothetical protein ACE41H_15250 [Paenibacillus enshidis]|uniref:Uncharacterized protein n=1 Tax=Paenibacillus enshidis TaxID=1458439 RepID=A0ABV5AVA2_9BACL